MLNYPSKRATQRSWDELYQDLCKYKNEHGHCRVPIKGGDTGLGLWVSKLKNNKATLTETQIVRLNILNFEWETLQESRDRLWLERLEELKDYKKKHGGSLRVNQKTHKQLSSWTAHQKRDQAKGTLRKDREELLDRIGFEWKSPNEIQKMNDSKQQPNTKSNNSWYKQYKKLVQFKEDNGHCIVPSDYSNDKSLAHWVRSQRVQHKNNDLPHDRYIELNDIGFVFTVDTGDANASINQRKWLERYELLQEYKTKFHTVDISRTVVYNNFNLGSWLRNQKVDAAMGNLDNRRHQMLKQLGVIFQFSRKERTWENQFNQLYEYYNCCGHCNLPSNYHNQSLVQWVNKQCNLAKLGELTIGQKKMLDSINFTYSHGVADTFVDKIPRIIKKKKKNRKKAATGTAQQKQTNAATTKDDDDIDIDIDTNDENGGGGSGGKKKNQQQQQNTATDNNDYSSNSDRSCATSQNEEEKESGKGKIEKILLKKKNQQQQSKTEEEEDCVVAYQESKGSDDDDDDNRSNGDSSSSSSGSSTQSEEEELEGNNVQIKKKKPPKTTSTEVPKKEKKKRDMKNDDDDDSDSDGQDNVSETPKKKKKTKKRKKPEIVTVASFVTTREEKEQPPKKKKQQQQQQQKDGGNDHKNTSTEETHTKESKKRKKMEEEEDNNSVTKDEASEEEPPRQKKKQKQQKDGADRDSERTKNEDKKQKGEGDLSKSSSRITGGTIVSFELLLSTLLDPSLQQTDEHAIISNSIKNALKNLSTKSPVKAKKFHLKMEKQLDLPKDVKSKIVEKCKTTILQEFVNKSQLLDVVVENDEKSIYITTAAAVNYEDETKHDEP